MIIRNLDENGDVTFGKGLNNYLTNDKAIGLNISTRIKSWLNDCFFAQTEGIDWKNRLGSKNQRVLLEQDLRRIVLQSFGVVGIISFSTSLDDRNFSGDYEITTIFSKSYKNNIKVGL